MYFFPNKNFLEFNSAQNLAPPPAIIFTPFAIERKNEISSLFWQMNVKNKTLWRAVHVKNESFSFFSDEEI